MEEKKLTDILTKEFNENVNSHVFLIETNNVESSLSEVKKILKNILNIDEISKIQLEKESYLELLIIRPDGTEIKKDNIFEIQTKIKNLPTIGKYIVYIILNSDKMNDSAANKLLKTIEEPNSTTLGFLITTNYDAHLSTIKSRCEHIKCNYVETIVNNESTNNEDYELASELVKLIETGNLVDFNIFKLNNDFKDNGKNVVNIIKEYYNIACGVQKGEISNGVQIIKNNNSFEKITRKSMYLNRLLNKLVKNMNTDLLLEKVYIELSEVK